MALRLDIVHSTALRRSIMILIIFLTLPHLLLLNIRVLNILQYTLIFLSCIFLYVDCLVFFQMHQLNDHQHLLRIFIINVGLMFLTILWFLIFDIFNLCDKSLFLKLKITLENMNLLRKVFNTLLVSLNFTLCLD